MARSLKPITMVVTVMAPTWMNAAQARREVRTLINHQSNYLSNGPELQEFEIKARSVRPHRP
jgi:hypothetical protein